MDGEAAGHVVSWTADDGRRYVGYWLGRPYWGRGVGTRALGMFLRLERVRPLYADPFHTNTASVRLLERHGFEHAGDRTARYRRAHPAGARRAEGHRMTSIVVSPSS